MATTLSIPATAVAKTKVTATPTTVKAAPAPKVVNPISPKVATAVTTGGAAGHGGVAPAVGVANYTTTYVATTAQVAVKPKTVVSAPVVQQTTNIHSSYR